VHVKTQASTLGVSCVTCLFAASGLGGEYDRNLRNACLRATRASGSDRLAVSHLGYELGLECPSYNTYLLQGWAGLKVDPERIPLRMFYVNVNNPKMAKLKAVLSFLRP
jgi:hypothetical protein